MSLHPKLGVVYHQVVLSNHLEKIAQAYKDDPAVSTAAMQVKLAVDAETFSIIKEAAGWFLPALKSAGKYALIGTGLMAPVAMTARYAINKARETAEKTTEDVRNKLLQTALGIGVIGGGIYGLKKLLSGDDDSPKTAEDESHILDDAMSKLATVVAIECMLDSVQDTVSEETQKLAAELHALNRGYGMQILYALVHE